MDVLVCGITFLDKLESKVPSSILINLTFLLCLFFIFLVTPFINTPSFLGYLIIFLIYSNTSFEISKYIVPQKTFFLIPPATVENIAVKCNGIVLF